MSEEIDVDPNFVNEFPYDIFTKEWEAKKTYIRQVNQHYLELRKYHKMFVYEVIRTESDLEQIEEFIDNAAVTPDLTIDFCTLLDTKVCFLLNKLKEVRLAQLEVMKLSKLAKGIHDENFEETIKTFFTTI